MDGGDPARTLRHDEGATAPLLESHQPGDIGDAARPPRQPRLQPTFIDALHVPAFALGTPAPVSPIGQTLSSPQVVASFLAHPSPQHCSPSFAAAVAHGSPPRVQPLTPPPPQPPRLGAHLGAQLGEQLGAQLGGQSEDMPEQQSQDWPDGLLPAVTPRAAAAAAHAARWEVRATGIAPVEGVTHVLPPEQYSLAQGAVPLPPNRSDDELDHFIDTMRLDHCLDVMQALAERDVAAAASEAAEQRVAGSEAAGAGTVQVFYGSRCVGRFTSTPMEQQPQRVPEQGPSGVSDPEGSDEPPLETCNMQ